MYYLYYNFLYIKKTIFQILNFRSHFMSTESLHVNVQTKEELTKEELENIEFIAECKSLNESLIKELKEKLRAKLNSKELIQELKNFISSILKLAKNNLHFESERLSNDAEKIFFIYRFLEYYSFIALGKFELGDALHGRATKRLSPQEVIEQMENMIKSSNGKIKCSDAKKLIPSMGDNYR